MDFDGTNIQLYNLEKDMGETRNLTDSKPAKVLELKNELEAWFRNYPLDIDLGQFLEYSLLWQFIALVCHNCIN